MTSHWSAMHVYIPCALKPIITICRAAVSLMHLLQVQVMELQHAGAPLHLENKVDYMNRKVDERTGGNQQQVSSTQWIAAVDWAANCCAANLRCADFATICSAADFHCIADALLLPFVNSNLGGLFDICSNVSCHVLAAECCDLACCCSTCCTAECSCTGKSFYCLCCWTPIALQEMTVQSACCRMSLHCRRVVQQHGTALRVSFR